MIDRKKMDEESGFKQRFIYITPYLKFNGQKGNFTLIERGEKNELGEVKELGEKVQIVLLKRGKFKLFTLGMFTNEGVPNRNDVVNLYETGEDKRKKMIDVGPWKDLKAKYNLKTKQLPYVLVLLEDGTKKIAKMGVLPSSLMNYWEYQNGFKVDGRPYEFITEISPYKAKSKGKDYFKMKFARVEKVESLEEIAKAVSEVADNVKREEDSFVKEDTKEESAGVKEMKKASEESKDGIPIINEDGEGGHKVIPDKGEEEKTEKKGEKKSDDGLEEDEINVDGIPF